MKFARQLENTTPDFDKSSLASAKAHRCPPFPCQEGWATASNMCEQEFV